MKKVVVLAGGDSSEREVSLQSGTGVARALKEAGFAVTILDPAEPGFPGKLLKIKNVYAVFIALHGGKGEDGTIQGFLETIGLFYTGSGIMASGLAMDKILSKNIFISAGLPVPPACSSRDFPLVVKPARGGSTLGISIVKKKAGLAAALNLARKYDARILTEKFIAGTEITVGILGNENPRILPAIQIVPASGFYDYRAKYVPGASRHLIPPELPQKWVSRASEVVLAAHRLLGCRGLSRSEVIIDQKGNPYLLDVNTIPGFTATSLFPEAAAAVGISFGELTRQLVELARAKE
ncbi:MAG: D-alanine--D-alanine ligase [Candidatus Omnitrophica bacterium]|nr:D-alanine--D-alanine ligase [Candidatus Omnitrophota bacterium]